VTDSMFRLHRRSLSLAVVTWPQVKQNAFRKATKK
jgi:hypothetical protein